MEKEKPIGVFDGGLGGLTVLRQIASFLPKESIIYYGDTSRNYYGSLSADEIIDYSMEAAAFLKSKNVKAVVTAGNTISAFAASVIRPKLSVPVIGMILPAAKKAVKITASGNIGVFGSKALVNSQAYSKQIQSLNSAFTIMEKEYENITGYSPAEFNINNIESSLRTELLPLIDNRNIDTLILASNFSPLYSELIHSITGGRIQLVDPCAAAAEMVRDELERVGMVSNSHALGRLDIYLSRTSADIAKTAEVLFGRPTGQINLFDASVFRNQLPPQG